MRNNKPAAVLLGVEDYQDLRALQSLREHLDDALMIHEATRTDSNAECRILSGGQAANRRPK
ncbi:MAG: hypothetical protein ACYDC9_00610 [Dermatophilaceae bacterium]